MISDAAEQWIQGEIRSSEYFADAREAAVARARADVFARLRLNHNAVLGSQFGRSLPGDLVFVADSRAGPP
jgi:hypothetical protein